MDMRTVTSFVTANIEKVIGVLAVAFIATVIILLIRSLKEGNDRSSSGGGSGGSDLDIDAIEGAMKRVLSTQPISVISAGGAGSSAGGTSGGSVESVHVDVPPAPVMTGDSADASQVAAMNEAIQVRDQRISQLTKELEASKLSEGEYRSKAATAGSGGGGVDPDLQAKLDELQARLSEYEIIEDDIADLSLFKEENARLKDEVEALKEKLLKAAAAPAAPVSRFKDDEKELKFEKAEKFELDPNDDIMKEFAAAVDMQKAPPPEQLSSIPTLQATTPSGDPQDAIDAMFAQASAPVASSAPADPQAAIDAMFAQASTPAVSSAPADPQAAIDAMFAQASAPVASSAPADPQAAIDALLAQSAETEQEAALAAMLEQAETTAAPVLDPQAAIDAMLAGETEKAQSPVEASTDSEDPLAGMLDTEKMLSEVESLEAAVPSDDDALSDTLDTDKLLAEVDELDGRVAKVAGTIGPADGAGDDDLLAEFKDTAKSGS